MHLALRTHLGDVLPRWRHWALETVGLLVRHLALQLPATALLCGAMANLPLVFMASTMGSRDQPWFKLLIGYAIPVAIVSGLAGIATLIALRHGGSARKLPEDIPLYTEGARSDRLALLVGAGLFGLCAWVASCFAAVVDVALESVRLLGEWGVWEDLRRGGQFSGFGLLPAMPLLGVPILEGTATLALAGGLVAALLLYFARSKRFAGTCVAVVLLQAGLILDTQFTIQLLHRGRPLVEAGLSGDPKATSLLAEWFARNDRAVVPMLHSLTWTLGFSICAAALLLRPRLGRSDLEGTHASWNLLAGATDAEKAAVGLQAVGTSTGGHDTRPTHFRRRTMK